MAVMRPLWAGLGWCRARLKPGLTKRVAIIPMLYLQGNTQSAEALKVWKGAVFYKT